MGEGGRGGGLGGGRRGEREGTPVDVGSLLRIGDVVVAVDGVVLGERRLKVVMAEVAKADVHTFTVRRL